MNRRCTSTFQNITIATGAVRCAGAGRRHTACACYEWLFGGFPDHDVAQVEGLARLDGEFRSDLRRGGAARGVVDDAIGGARDQAGQFNSACGIEDQLVLVVDWVSLGQAGFVGAEEARRGWRDSRADRG